MIFNTLVLPINTFHWVTVVILSCHCPDAMLHNDDGCESVVGSLWNEAFNEGYSCSLSFTMQAHSLAFPQSQQVQDPQKIRPQLQHGPTLYEASYHDLDALKARQGHSAELTEASYDRIMQEVMDIHDHFATASQRFRILQLDDLKGALADKSFRLVHVPCRWLQQGSGTVCDVIMPAS